MTWDKAPEQHSTCG